MVYNMKVTKYDNKVLSFTCDKCNNYAEREVDRLISDECAVEIELVCPYCKEDKQFVYFMRCTDPARAPELQAKMDFLKMKRAAEGENGN